MGPGLGGAATEVPRKQQWCPAGDMADRSGEKASTTWLFTMTAISLHVLSHGDRDFGWDYCPHFAEEEAKVRVDGVTSLRAGGGRSPSLERRQRRRRLPAAPSW